MNKTQKRLAEVLASHELKYRYHCKMMDRMRETDNGCWEWTTKSVFEGGYGAVSLGRGVPALRAHVLSYLFNTGEVPKNFVCHTCDNPSCFNPDHLFEGTVKDNVQDAVKKGRIKPPPLFCRSTYPRSKLSVEDCKFIQERTDLSALELASLYSVSRKTIYTIRRGDIGELS